IRLSKKAYNYGLIAEEDWKSVRHKIDLITEAQEWIETERVLVSTAPFVRDSIKNRIRSKNGTFESFLKDSQNEKLKHEILGRPDLVHTIETEIAYEGYVK